MSERETILLLGDIQAAINNIAAFTKDMTFEMYQSDLRTKHAVERNFEIIGEAVSRIPGEFKVLHPQIEWRILKDFRNFIIHEYFGINDEIVWDTIQLRIPELSDSFSDLLK
ncbi:MAG TPA: DUF86 domain-containing protein [Hanamia sp.]|jgi:Uncharacterized conserved protein